MQPAKISIIGDFIDSQIYRGRLYLWTLDGTLCTYNWNDLVDSLYDDGKEKLAYTFTFKDGHYLYKHSLTEIFEEVCPYYLSLGMTLTEYWEGSPHLVKYYRQKHRIQIRTKPNALVTGLIF